MCVTVFTQTDRFVFRGEATASETDHSLETACAD